MKAQEGILPPRPYGHKRRRKAAKGNIEYLLWMQNKLSTSLRFKKVPT